ncbi:MAG: PIN domain-containing protein [Candidatus Micrarchaeota archaeon]
MRIVIDANILFAALLRKGLTRRLLFNSDIKLLAPGFILAEFIKHRNYLIGKFDHSPDEFDELSSNILSVIELVPDNELEPYLGASKTLVTDLKDCLYIAVALKENAAIWSNDGGMKTQRRIKVYTTDELASEFGLL